MKHAAVRFGAVVVAATVLVAACHQNAAPPIEKPGTKAVTPATEPTDTPVPSASTPVVAPTTEPTVVTKPSEVDEHRASSTPCEKVTPLTPKKVGDEPAVVPGSPCKSNKDCKQPNGRCSAAGTCATDECYVDSDCREKSAAKGGVCVCSERGQRGWYCLRGNCSVDADCGKGQQCSPTYGMSCGAFSGTVGWYCHTPKDKCRSHGDCQQANGYCAFNPEVGHWTCGYGVCVG